MNPSVIAIDTVDRKVEDGVLKSQRLICADWSLPHWAVRLLGAEPTFAIEHSEVDPSNKRMTMSSKNLTFCNKLSVMEKVTYLPNPNNRETTLLKQESVVTVHGVPLSSYFEQFITNTISGNANKGRQAMEWVIGKINNEVQELTKSVDELAASARRLQEEMANPHHSIPAYHFRGSEP